MDEWEARLTAEGMPSELGGGCPLFVDPRRAMAVIADVPGSNLPFTSGPDYSEVERLEVLAAWLPARDRLILGKVRQGQSHGAIGRSIGISRPVTTRQVQRATGRLKGLASIEGLPDRPDGLLALLLAHSVSARDEVYWTALADLPNTWQVQAISRSHGIPGTTLRQAMYRLDGLTDAASLFVRLVRRLPCFRCPGHQAQEVENGPPVVP